MSCKPTLQRRYSFFSSLTYLNFIILERIVMLPAWLLKKTLLLLSVGLVCSSISGIWICVRNSSKNFWYLHCWNRKIAFNTLPPSWMNLRCKKSYQAITIKMYYLKCSSFWAHSVSQMSHLFVRNLEKYMLTEKSWSIHHPWLERLLAPDRKMNVWWL